MFSLLASGAILDGPPAAQGVSLRFYQVTALVAALPRIATPAFLLRLANDETFA
jgi:hypothetical protein